jgi:hypothetical protein
MANPPDDPTLDGAANPGQGQVQRGNTRRQPDAEPDAVLFTAADSF